MDINSFMNVTVTGELYDENMNLKQKFVKHNLIVDKGYDFISDCFGNSTRPAAMRYIAVGTGTAAPAATNTALGSEVLRKACTYTHTASSKFFTLNVTFNPGEASAALTEAGVFNATSGGSMFDRVTYPVINKDALDTFIVSFQVTLKEVETA